MILALWTQFGVEGDDVETTGVRLGGLHFGASPEKSGQVSPFPGPSVRPAATAAGGGSGENSNVSQAEVSSRLAASGDGDGNSGRGTSTAGVVGGDDGKPSFSSPFPSSGISMDKFCCERPEAHGMGGAASASSASGAPWAGPGAAAVSQERLAAETAFATMDQNSGRVSTHRFEELLTLLGTPGARRKEAATESARTAGLLSAFSFSREDFIKW